MFGQRRGTFKPYLIQSDFTVAGFSLWRHPSSSICLYICKERIDTLQLFSPAFFEDRDAKFKKLQTLSFAKNTQAYCANFVNALACEGIEAYFQQGNLEELETLLHHSWEREKLEALKNRGVRIEVYVGEQDAIINALTCKDFFSSFCYGLLP